MAKMIFGRKGQVEAQFNWIFVLVVGGVILLFFTFIVLKQKTFSEQKLSATLAGDLEVILAGASVSKGTAHSFNIPGLETDFDCSRFYLGQANKPLGKQVVFAPSKVKGDKLLTWTLDWNAPFFVTNFMFITSDQLRYVFVYDDSGSDLMDLINQSLPAGLNKELYKVSSSTVVSVMNSISDKNNYKVRFVFVGGFNKQAIPNYFPKSLSGMAGDDVTALLISSTDVSSPVRDIFFFKSSKGSFVSSGSSYSLDFVSAGDVLEVFPSLFGAIFSDDVDVYDCVMGKAFERFNLVSQVYDDKSSRLKVFYDATPGKAVCATSMGNALSSIGGLVSSSSSCNNFAGPSCDVSVISNISDSAYNLDSKNEGLLLRSCALVY